MADHRSISYSESDFGRTIQARGTHSGNPVSPIDLRVTPAMGSRNPTTPGSLVRVSVVTNLTAPLVSEADADFFDFEQPFEHRWTNKFLHSAIKQVTPGEATNFTINGTDVQIFVPTADEGARGVVIADPCFHGAAAGCSYGEKFQTFSRMTALLNLATADPAGTGMNAEYWMILGDNFYDRDGHLAQAWFDQLTLETKSKVFATVAGNHDYWGAGDGLLAIDKDQFGNGNVQFYGMDSVASINAINSSVPGNFMDLSVDPDAPKTHHQLAAMENFFSYFLVGNVGFILYSGGYTYQDSKPLFQEACAWLKESKPDVAFVTGHWNDAGLGCSATMDVPAVYSEIKGFDGCAQLDDAQQLKYIMGHTHCNEVTATDKRGDEPALGMMVAGQGMEGCGNFGVPMVDTKPDGRVEVVYYEVQSVKSSTDRYDDISKCFATKGIGACQDLGTVWLNQTLNPVQWS